MASSPINLFYSLRGLCESLRRADFTDEQSSQDLLDTFFRPDMSFVPWSPDTTLVNLIDYCRGRNLQDVHELVALFKHFLVPLEISKKTLHDGVNSFVSMALKVSPERNEFFVDLFTSVLFPLAEQQERDKVATILRGSLTLDQKLKELAQIYRVETFPADPLVRENYRELLSAPYVTKSIDVVGFFAEYLSYCALGKTDYFSGKETTYSLPFAALCQMSGSGKTRLLLELARRFFYELYVCLKGGLSPSNITTYLTEFLKVTPRANNEAIESFESRFETVRTRARHLLVAMYYFTRANMASKTLAEFSKDFEPSIDTQTATNHWNEIISKANDDGHRLEGEFRAEVGKPVEDEFFVFAFDEASMLLPPRETLQILESPESTDADLEMARNAVIRSPFMILRKVAFDLQGNHNRRFVLVFSDSNIKITNFTKEYAGISPIRDEFLPDIVPAFFGLSSSDVKAKDELVKIRDMIEAEEKGEYKWKEYMDARDNDFRILASFGSPLWADYLKSRSEGASKLVDYADMKLLNYLSPKHKDIASLACRSIITICPSGQLPVDLVSQSLYQIDYLSMNGDHVYTHFPSDPTVAAVAANYQETNGLQALKSLKAHLSNAEIDVGDVGETMAQFILLSAMDHLSQADRFKSVSLSAFLKLILGVTDDAGLKELGLSDDVLEGSKVFFNHFVRLEDPIKYENLAFAFGRGAALLGNFNQKAFDIFIPFVRENGMLSCLLIQIKNYRRDYNLDVAEATSMKNFFKSLCKHQVYHPNAETTSAVPTKRTSSRKEVSKPVRPSPPCVKIIINMRQGLYVENGASKVVCGIIMVPCMLPSWEKFLWNPGKETLDLIRSFLYNDMERKCETERPKPFVEYLKNTNHWQWETVSRSNPIIEATFTVTPQEHNEVEMAMDTN